MLLYRAFAEYEPADGSFSSGRQDTVSRRRKNYTELGYTTARRAYSAEVSFHAINSRQTLPARLPGADPRHLRLRGLLGSDVVCVSESGIQSAADIRMLRSHNIGAFLIGEGFMRAPDPGEALRDVLAGVRA